MSDKACWVGVLVLALNGFGGVALHAATPPVSATSTVFDLASADLVDLTWALGPDTLFWPTATEAFKLEKDAEGITPGGWFYAANSFCAPEHGGTHLDAPYHFDADGHKTDEIALSSLIAPVVVIDVTKAAAADADYTLRPEDVAAWEATHGQIPRGAVALLRTGWSARWPNREAYFGSAEVGTANNLHFPSFGAAAVKILLERGVVALGVDTASIDPGNSKDFPVHRLAGAANVPGLENLAHLEALPTTGAWIVALPVKIAGGSGGPARVVGLVPRAGK